MIGVSAEPPAPNLEPGATEDAATFVPAEVEKIKEVEVEKIRVEVDKETKGKEVERDVIYVEKMVYVDRPVVEVEKVKEVEKIKEVERIVDNKAPQKPKIELSRWERVKKAGKVLGKSSFHSNYYQTTDSAKLTTLIINHSEGSVHIITFGAIASFGI
jgi:hypothetical protein